MLTSSVNPAASSTSTAASGTSKSNMDEAQDRFLKLLVAQLNNQDPMNPMDNAQMTSQMAQINTVTGIQQVNDTLKNMAEQFTAMQVLQGSNLVGHNVLMEGNKLTITDGKASGAVNLAARAESVKVDVMSPGGQVVDSFNLGALDAGQHGFTWDASSYTYGGTPTFKITATLGGKPIENTALSVATVQAVGSSNGAMTVQLHDGTSVPYSAIKTIL
ncbi:flagellar hook assembly protein FlgD [Rhodoferax antarcticus]|uniref:Basal-body rod modification protein FlgD n=1 Tax=Rhodoferax antarcticus ANT.BR TaxID=1111071 RepID=A0A1Q8YGF9_9BURK|nr:flagellar hook capping FlgD N-terminal domain-containing protein [Rhodoferax antarcticus]APW45595.1 flagellar biosynthesis protein FlgD [Rhodoferax antarcticus]MCW2312826.1 flagellar basal-body rod modification protein FlgD [Rhodoferax antarcticus]OLP07082.1 Flagellar hook capping protein [Rhodoferax antarcticus ANT.BR]